MLHKILKIGILDFSNQQCRHIFNFIRKKKDIGKWDIVRVGNVSAERAIPEHITKPPYYYEMLPQKSTCGRIEIKTAEQIELMRQSCKLAANVLKKCENVVKVGVTTDEIDEFVHNEIITNNAYPSPLRYSGFPKSVCTSVNNVACHGIPDDRALVDGDIINIDITTFYRGYHGDCSRTFLVGNVDERGRFLCKITEECLNNAIGNCRPGIPFNIIGNIVEGHAEKNGLNIIPAFIGHGIGEYFHGPPEILHFRNEIEDCMMTGMTFTIEPILTLGECEIEIQEDDWTATTVDNARTAQYEHTILVTETGVEILTLPD